MQEHPKVDSLLHRQRAVNLTSHNIFLASLSLCFPCGQHGTKGGAYHVHVNLVPLHGFHTM